MNCLFGNDNKQTRRRIQYVEVRGPKGANLLPIRNMLLNEMGAENVQVYISREHAPENVEIYKLNGQNARKVYEGSG